MSHALSIAPSVWLGPTSTLAGADFLSSSNTKIIINCSPTSQFLCHLDHISPVISSDVIVLSFDPGFDESGLSEHEKELLAAFHSKYNRILQNYLTHFYTYNANRDAYVHLRPNNEDLTVQGPVLAGASLEAQFFVVNRLIKLIKNTNPDVGVLILDNDCDLKISLLLIISYLMDSYNYDFNASYAALQSIKPGLAPFNPNFYNDLILIEHLKKFYEENMKIKAGSSCALMTVNYKLKRRCDDDEPLQHAFVSCGGDKRIKRQLKYPKGYDF